MAPVGRGDRGARGLRRREHRLSGQRALAFDIRRLVAEGDTVVTEVHVTDGAIEAVALTFHTVRAGRITKQVEYWPDPYDPPEWRAQWVRRI
ncbi:MAG: nuclear transport factor 2 family protein [Roseicyclus sp.]|nr:nuclear transport factor 2 family protein [Roseicyclus sp.]MBO6624248.1 nuclear transport factor 2 family protein [Roseicyclus sp.]MBO6921401.1 nuclear transport factor 2 family protein [Roseicyclus sp.]